MHRISFLILFSICFSQFSFSQKYGYIDYRMLIDSLSEGKIINEQLNKYEKSLSDVGQQMVLKFQENFKKYQDAVTAGSLTAIQRKDMETNLETEQSAINNYQKSANESLEKRNAELLKPFLDNLTIKIKEFAAKEGYTMIFDSSRGLIQYPESDNLLGRVVVFVDKK